MKTFYVDLTTYNKISGGELLTRLESLNMTEREFSQLSGVGRISRIKKMIEGKEDVSHQINVLSYMFMHVPGALAAARYMLHQHGHTEQRAITERA